MSATKIVIVAGQQFSVPAETDNESIRQQLIGMGFADVQNATVKEGKQGGTTTVEFVKKAGTKGLLTGRDLAEKLRRLPAAKTSNTQRVIDRLNGLGDGYTFDQALADENVFEAVAAHLDRMTAKGGPLCERLSALPAVASRERHGW